MKVWLEITYNQNKIKYHDIQQFMKQIFGIEKIEVMAVEKE
jgi:hypothetical protein